MPLPDRRGREQILLVHLKNKRVSPTVDVEAVARRTPGWAGADLARLANDAAITAVRDNVSAIGNEQLASSLETIALGRARTSALVTERDREITAWHEAGHTLVALNLEQADKPVAVSITPRGPAGGVTWLSGTDDLFLTKTAALAKLAVSLGGREAEKILLDGDFTSGAHSDLTHATRLSTAMISQYGMYEGKLTVIDDQALIAGGQVADEINANAEKLLEQAAKVACEVLLQNQDKLKQLAELLLEHESLTAEQLEKYLNKNSGL